MARSIASNTLEKARYFLHQAAAAEADLASPRIAYAANLEAAIIYGHAVWDHLRSEFRHHPKYKVWCDHRYTNLNANHLFQFMSERGGRTKPSVQIGRRHSLVHRGGEHITLTTAVHIMDHVNVRDSLSVVIRRAEPWYRRPPRIIYHDLTYPLRQCLYKLRNEFAARRAKASTPPSSVSVTKAYYFDDLNWNSQPAREVVRQYLDLMEQEIAAAEGEFR